MQFTLPLSSYPDAETPYAQPHTRQTHPQQRPKRKSVNPIMVGVTIGLSVLVVLAVILFVASRYGNKPVEPETSGYVVDTVATAPDYEFVDEPLPEIDTMQADSLEQKQEQEAEQEPDDGVEPVPEEVKPVEADTTAL